MELRMSSLHAFPFCINVLSLGSLFCWNWALNNALTLPHIEVTWMPNCCKFPNWSLFKKMLFKPHTFTILFQPGFCPPRPSPWAAAPHHVPALSCRCSLRRQLHDSNQPSHLYLPQPAVVPPGTPGGSAGEGAPTHHLPCPAGEIYLTLLSIGHCEIVQHWQVILNVLCEIATIKREYLNL